MFGIFSLTQRQCRCSNGPILKADVLRKTVWRKPSLNHHIIPQGLVCITERVALRQPTLLPHTGLCPYTVVPHTPLQLHPVTEEDSKAGIPPHNTPWLPPHMEITRHPSHIEVVGAHSSPNSPPNHPKNQRPTSVRSGYSASTDSSPRALPSDEELLREIRTMLASADLMTVTKKSVREEMGRRFGVDLSAKKDYIHRCIDEVLKGA